MRLRGGGFDTERTYAMIKPDAVKAGKVDAMQSLIKAGGFKIIKQKTMKLSKSKVYLSLPNFMLHTSVLCVCLCVSVFYV